MARLPRSRADSEEQPQAERNLDSLVTHLGLWRAGITAMHHSTPSYFGGTEETDCSAAPVLLQVNTKLSSFELRPLKFHPLDPPVLFFF